MNSQCSSVGVYTLHSQSTAVYESFKAYFTDNESAQPWTYSGDINALADILKKRIGVTAKYRQLTELLYDGRKPSKEADEEFRFNRDAILRLLAGGTVKAADLFHNEDYAECGTFSLGADEEKMGEIMSAVGEDYELIRVMRGIYDWTLLNDILEGCQTVSEAKVKVYEQHKADLSLLKRIIRKYGTSADYRKMFRAVGEKNYVAYTGHLPNSSSDKNKRCNAEDFSKFVKGMIADYDIQEEDAVAVQDMKERLDLNAFLPKQKNTDNRVIPHQLYWHELNAILQKASGYLPFLNDSDEDGKSVSDKILSVFEFRIPYFVGPLNPHSPYAWIERKAGKIYPWNFEEMVDQDASEQKFIEKLTNYCTYMPGEPVVPKDSLCYQRFMVLNEINNIRINGEKISVEMKQRLVRDLFMQRKKVTRKQIEEYLISEGLLEKDNRSALTGIDISIKSSMSSYIAFRRLLDSKTLSEDDVEHIIERSAFAEEKNRLYGWLSKQYPHLSPDDIRYICRIRINDFGNLSRRFLTGLEGSDKSTGEIYTILRAMWDTNHNLMELLSSDFTFKEEIEEIRDEYYAGNPRSLSALLDEMYLSNAVKRPVFRTLAIIKDIEKAFGRPARIFVEMTRGEDPSRKGQRTKSRKDQMPRNSYLSGRRKCSPPFV